MTMGFLDKAKAAATGHEPQIDEAIDKAANVADQHVDTKYDNDIDKAAAKAKTEIDKT